MDKPKKEVAPKSKKSAAAPEFMELRLYVAGQSAKSLTAFANLKKICEEQMAGRYRIEVIDLLVNPQLAGGIKSWPSPPWCGNCPNRCARSSATSPTPSGCWWDWTSGRSNKYGAGVLACSSTGWKACATKEQPAAVVPHSPRGLTSGKP